MSADAKVWFDEPTRQWRGIHDSPCTTGERNLVHVGTEYGLVGLMQAIEKCEKGGRPMRWVLHSYPTGLGLRGFCV